MERRAVLIRDESSDQGRRRVLTAGALTLHVMEPPDRGNRPNRSCIPTGRYFIYHHRSPRCGRVLAAAFGTLVFVLAIARWQFDVVANRVL